MEDDYSFTEFILIVIGLLIGSIVIPLMIYYIYLKVSTRDTSIPIFGTLRIPYIPKLFELSTLTINTNIFVVFVSLLLIGVIVTTYFIITKINVEASNSDYKTENKYITQKDTILSMYPKLHGNEPVSTLISSLGDSLPNNQNCFVNFYSFGCRFTGYLGPMKEGYWEPAFMIDVALKAGCRTFVLDIDYIDECVKDNKYYPRIVVRDVNNRLRIKHNSHIMCNSEQNSNIREVCDLISQKAFSEDLNNSTDPIIIVLYFLRVPSDLAGNSLPDSSTIVLDYYSDVAKCLSPFTNRLLTNELNGGTFNRQANEDTLIINNITDYNNKVLIFSNAETKGFRNSSYKSNEDLDYLVNLRLTYKSNKLGITQSGSDFGILESVEHFKYIPDDKRNKTIDETKKQWSICLSKDPCIPVTEKDIEFVTSNYGVNCVPSVLFDETNQFIANEIFKVYSFYEKPLELRYTRPAIIKPSQQSPDADCRGGNIMPRD